MQGKRHSRLASGTHLPCGSILSFAKLHESIFLDTIHLLMDRHQWWGREFKSVVVIENIIYCISLDSQLSALSIDMINAQIG